MDDKIGVKNDMDISADMEERRVHNMSAPWQAVTGTVCINCFGSDLLLLQDKLMWLEDETR